MILRVAQPPHPSEKEKKRKEKFDVYYLATRQQLLAVFSQTRRNSRTRSPFTLSLFCASLNALSLVRWRTRVSSLLFRLSRFRVSVCVPCTRVRRVPRALKDEH